MQWGGGSYCCVIWIPFGLLLSLPAEMPPNVTFRPSEALFHFCKNRLDFTCLNCNSHSWCTYSMRGHYVFRKRWIKAILGVECQFLSGWKPSVAETLSHYSLIELELYCFLGYVLEQQNQFSSTSACQRETEFGGAERMSEWSHEIPASSGH